MSRLVNCYVLNVKEKIYWFFLIFINQMYFRLLALLLRRICSKIEMAKEKKYINCVHRFSLFSYFIHKIKKKNEIIFVVDLFSIPSDIKYSLAIHIHTHTHSISVVNIFQFCFYFFHFNV